ncbi:MAG: glycerol-3-phosphate 1-O-acyltransferase PlsY [Anaerovoracaceae bacterium]|jgi:glycerol-3-phosphate acyltransferase PlsY
MYSFTGLLQWSGEYWLLVIAALIAYLMGNISPSILIARAHGIDIRKEGSGNAGTTNVLRVLGKKAAAATLIIDVLKGTVAVVLAGVLLGQQAAMICVVAVMVGHVWPIFFRFKGGKGVATAFGALCGLDPLLGLSALGVVVVFVLITRRMSAGSIAGAAFFPVLAYFFEPDFIILGSVLALIVLWKHRSNIGRLVRGEEPKMSFKK